MRDVAKSLLKSKLRVLIHASGSVTTLLTIPLFCVSSHSRFFMKFTTLDVYLVIVNLIGFAVGAVNSKVRSKKAEGKSDVILALLSVLGGSIGCLLSVLIFDRKAEKGHRFFLPISLIPLKHGKSFLTVQSAEESPELRLPASG